MFWKSTKPAVFRYSDNSKTPSLSISMQRRQRSPSWRSRRGLRAGRVPVSRCCCVWSVGWVAWWNLEREKARGQRKNEQKSQGRDANHFSICGRVPAHSEARQNPSPKLQNSHFWLELAPFQGGLGVPERLGKRYFNFIRHCKRLRNIVSDLKKRIMGSNGPHSDGFWQEFYWCIAALR